MSTHGHNGRPPLRAPLLDDDAGDVAPLRRSPPAQHRAQPDGICDGASCSPGGRSAGGCGCDETEELDTPPPPLTAPATPTHPRRPRTLALGTLLACTLSLAVVVALSSSQTSLAPPSIAGAKLARTLNTASSATQAALQAAATEHRAAQQRALRTRRRARQQAIQRAEPVKLDETVSSRN